MLAQLGSRVQHALRAFTPKDAKALQGGRHHLPDDARPGPRGAAAVAGHRRGGGHACSTSSGVPTPVVHAKIDAPKLAHGPGRRRSPAARRCSAQVRDAAGGASPPREVLERRLPEPTVEPPPRAAPATPPRAAARHRTRGDAGARGHPRESLACCGSTCRSQVGLKARMTHRGDRPSLDSARRCAALALLPAPSQAPRRCALRPDGQAEEPRESWRMAGFDVTEGRTSTRHDHGRRHRRSQAGGARQARLRAARAAARQRVADDYGPGDGYSVYRPYARPAYNLNGVAVDNLIGADAEARRRRTRASSSSSRSARRPAGPTTPAPRRDGIHRSQADLRGQGLARRALGATDGSQPAVLYSVHPARA